MYATPIQGMLNNPLILDPLFNFVVLCFMIIGLGTLRCYEMLGYIRFIILKHLFKGMLKGRAGKLGEILESVCRFFCIIEAWFFIKK